MYFVACNQFWIHKNHTCALRAFRVFLAEFDARYDLVLTGETFDYGLPNYFDQIKEWIRELKLEVMVRILGHIPKEHQIALMRDAVSVIQPTLFEGGQVGASYEAIGLGVPLIVSDIPYSKEIQDKEGVYFFRSGDVGDLASQMITVGQSKAGRPDVEALRNRPTRRRQMFGDFLSDRVEQIVDGASNYYA
ncbi:glycosyltransferase [Gammaproteobacteria bacterium]|nr:glycosyltransferase [Gammaproteobacteria bacterium]